MSKKSTKSEDAAEDSKKASNPSDSPTGSKNDAKAQVKPSKSLHVRKSKSDDLVSSRKTGTSKENLKKSESTKKMPRTKSKTPQQKSSKVNRKKSTEKQVSPSKRKSSDTRTQSKRTQTKDRQEKKSKKKSAEPQNKRDKTAKKKSDEGHRSSSKKRSSKKRKKSNKSSGRSARLSTEKRAEIETHVWAIEATRGPNPIASEDMISAALYEISTEAPKLYASEYSTVQRATNSNIEKCGGGVQLVVKTINLDKCSPRHRANLLKTSVRILRYISGNREEELRSDMFVRVYDLFLVKDAQLLIFMEACQPDRLLYDLVKCPQQKLQPSIVRRWCRAIVTCVMELQRMGIAHRAIKLHHIGFDLTPVCNPKLIGWSKAVLFYEPNKRRTLLQHKERRARHNYHLPPEAFQGSYDPSSADVWSIGVILINMCTKRYPFLVRDARTKFSSQWREFVKRNALNEHVRKLCSLIFAIRPKHRMTSEAILKHGYFSVPDTHLVSCSTKGAATGDLKQAEESRVGAGRPVNPVESSKDESKAGELNEETVEEEEQGEDTNDDATGLEGGAVGEEFTPDELHQQSQGVEVEAPEEAAAAAQPEEGEEVTGENAEESAGEEAEK